MIRCDAPTTDRQGCPSFTDTTAPSGSAPSVFRRSGTLAITAALALAGCGGSTTTLDQAGSELRACQSDPSGAEKAACFLPAMHAAEDLCSARSQTFVVAPDWTITCATPPNGQARAEAQAKATLAAEPHYCWSAREGGRQDCHPAAIAGAIVQLERLVRASCPAGDRPFVGAERAVAGCGPARPGE